MEFSRKRLLALFYLVSAVLLIAANIFVFGTLDVYRENSAEFEAGYLDMFGSLRSWGGLLVILCLTPGFLLSVDSVKKYASFLLVLGILTWLQASFLMWDYGVLDGRGVDWQQYNALGWLEIGLWFVSLVVSLRFASHLLAYTNMIAWILIVGQTAMLLNHGGLNQGGWSRENTASVYPPEALFEISKQQNIFHIVLDSMQTDVFLELIDKHDWYDELSGFTLFYENSGVTPHTSLALPAVFSGEVFDVSESPSTYYKRAMTHGFQNTLYQAGFTVNLVPQLSMRESNYSNYYEIPSTYNGTVENLVDQNAALLLDMALFRTSPHFIRKSLYQNGDWFLLPIVRGKMEIPSFQQKAFFSDYVQGLKPGDDKPAYHFIHLMPPHPPYVTLADGSYAGSVLPNTRENYLNEAQAISELVVQFIEKLKSLGVYDETLIILQGDHGSQINPMVDGKEIQTCLSRLPALLAVKPTGSNGLLEISHLPTSLLDVRPTVLSVLSDEGISVFELDESLARKRKYLVYNSSNSAANIVNYSIYGSVFDPQSCHRENQLTVNSGQRHYELGSEIQFGMAGSGDSFMGVGWSVCQANHCWSNGNVAELEFPINNVATALVLEARFTSFIDVIKAAQQRIGVSVNGTRLTEWLVAGNEVQNASVRIPAELVHGKSLRIEFYFPDAVSPKSIGIGGDSRLLGMALTRIRISVPGSD